jgi:hypothetical protein
MKYSNPLISTLLIGTGLLNLVAPVLAEGTLANTDISNTATATYQDPTGATSNTTSNTVVVTVAEVAGITITAGAIGNTTNVGKSPVANDALTFEFDLTNTGNDTTDFFVPNQAQVGASPITVQKVQYFKATALGVGTWEDVSGLTNNVVNKNSTDGTAIKPGDIVKVRVLATVNAGTTTGAINVTLGNGGPNIQNLQNDPFAATGGDVYTVDKNYVLNSGEVDGAPSNGVREAVATATTAVNPGKQAFVKVTKVAGTVDNNGSTDNITDDKVTYDLALNVAKDAPGGTNLVAEDLAGTSMTIDTIVVPRILVSDAIPTGAKLAAIPVAPAGWTVIYSTTPIGTTTATSPAVVWTATAPAVADLGTVTRVGYVKSGIIAKDTTVTGFKLTLKLNLPATGGSVLNIAQAFGTTAVAGAPDPTKPAVDESGDKEYNNLNLDGTPGPIPTNGIATGADGTDTDNNNEGTGSGGEANIVTVAPLAAAGITPIFNGPENKPTAMGPSGATNDDFTNKSVTIDTTQAQWTSGVPNAVDPQSMGFTNTVSQDPSVPVADKRPQYVALLPTTPVNKADLPNDTIVKITYAGITAAYKYNNTTGIFTQTAGTTPITLTVPTTGSVSYGVDIDLPLTAQLQSYSVPITSFSNGAPAVIDPSTGVELKTAIVLPAGDLNVIDATDAQNVTIDRLYTGYLKMAKEAQVYKIVGGVTTIISPFSSSTPKAAPGEFIEYRIKYSNISEATTPTSGSVAMNASNIVILEKGNDSASGNNWGTFTDHKPGTANDSNGVIKFDGGTKTNGDLIVGEYTDTIPTLAPGSFGTFTFTRQVK